MMLADLYDADQRTRNETVRDTAANYLIPHPLSSVQYADGRGAATAGRDIHAPWINPKESQ